MIPGSDISGLKNQMLIIEKKNIFFLIVLPNPINFEVRFILSSCNEVKIFYLHLSSLLDLIDAILIDLMNALLF